MEIYLEFVKKNWKLYCLLLLTLLSLPLQKLAIPHYYGKILESLKIKKLSQSTKIFYTLLLIWIVIQILNISLSLVKKLIWPRLQAFIRQRFFNMILDRYSQDYQELKLGDIETKLHEIPWLIDDIYSKFQRFILNNSIIIIGSFIYLTRHHYYLGICYIASILCIILLSTSYVNKCKNHVYVEHKQYDDLFEEIDDTLQNTLSIYTNKKIDYEKDKIKKLNDNIQEKQIKSSSCNIRYQIIYAIINVIVFLLLNGVAYLLYKEKKINLAVFTSVFIINFNLLDDLIILYYDARSFVQIKGEMELVNNFLKSLPSQKKIGNKRIGIQKHIDIKFKNIYYKPSNADDYLYKNLNLHIPANQDVMIMGGIGSGKSTFAKLLSRLQIQNKGLITLNNINIDDIHINDIRDNIMYIPQHPQLFNRTLWYNITYGLTDKERKSVSPKIIYDLLKKLGMNDLLNVYREKMDKLVGKKGSHLSGGQRQIVWLLRSIFKKNPVVILDEPTSSLDSKSTSQVIKFIEYLKKTKSVIIISHNNSLVKLADRLIVLDKGVIVKDQKK